MSSPKRTIRWSHAVGLALLATGLSVPGTVQARPGRGASKDVARGKKKGKNRLEGLQVIEGDDGTVTLRLRGSTAPTYNVYRLEGPPRLVVDLSAARRGKVVPRLPLDTWAAGPVSVEEVTEPGGRIVRMTVALKRPSSYIVVPDGRALVVTITPRTAPPESYFARKSAAERKAAIEAAERRAKALEARASKMAEQAAARVAEAERALASARRKEAEAADKAAAARKELDGARVGRLRLKRQLARAEQARAEAEKARRAAERALAERKAAAERDREAAAKLRAEAERKLAEAEQTLARARATSAEADAAMARARATSAKANEAMARAHRAIKEAEAKRRQAEQVLARARKAQTAAERARRQAEAKARVRRSEREAAALARARKVEREAEAKARRAQRDLDRARREVAALRAEAAALRAEAAADRASAREQKAQAAALLAKAGAEMRRAAEEKAAAERARKQAERALAEARAAVRRARSKRVDGAERAAVERALSQAKEAAARAKARAREADETLARLRADRDRLAKMLDAQRAANAKLLAAKARAEGTARKDLAQVREQMAAERARLETLERRVARAQKTLDERLARLEKERAEQSKLAEAWARERKAAGTTRIEDVRFEQDRAHERIVVRAQGPIEFESTMLTPTVHMLRIKGAKLPKKLEQSLDASRFGGPVRTVTAFAEGRDVKVLVSAEQGVVPRVREGKGGLTWTFPRPKTARAAAAPKKAPRPVHHPEPKVGAYASNARSAHAAPSSARRTSRRGRKWRGERIDIELQDAPIKDVLLLFSDIGRVNIIAGQGVEGTVTMKLTAVPWDQALDIILRSLGLGMVREGNVIRVATLEAIEEERRKAIEAANARVQLKPLETRLVPVSYATVDEMIPKVQSVLSPRGTVTPDSRTNTLIIMDVAENIALAEQLVAQLDSQTPQVLIEARIVEARTSFLRQLGIQWGLGFIASPGTGNPTGLLFPYSVGIGGGASGRPPDTRGLVLPGAAQNPNYAVDLPAPVGTGAGGAMGFTFGNISGNLQTNLRLSAAEDTGEVRIISAPKIVTLDNTQAQIEQGVQIPISQVSAQGVNTRYVNATLALRVTPHVTNEGAVLLEVQVQKNEADFVNTGARGDPTILTKQARSRMLVNDGDTAVIGGIYTRNKSVNFKKVPWIADIPIIGWFFKNKTEADTRTEVLIFLTPRIVNRASSIGG